MSKDINNLQKEILDYLGTEYNVIRMLTAVKLGHPPLSGVANDLEILFDVFSEELEDGHSNRQMAGRSVSTVMREQGFAPKKDSKGNYIKIDVVAAKHFKKASLFEKVGGLFTDIQVG